MKYSFISPGYNFDEITYPLNEFVKFYQGEENLFAINGFALSGKYELANLSLKFLSDEVLLFKYICSKVTSLDDILLSFYADFRNFHNAGKIKLKKISEENFAKKISFYFNTVKAPCLIILDNFDGVFDYSVILNFLKHLNGLSNVKFIVLTKKQIISDFEDFSTRRLKINPIAQEQVKLLLKSSGIEASDMAYEEFYKASKGLKRYLDMTIHYLNTVKISFFDFLTEYNKRAQSYEEFILSKIISLISDNYNELLWLLVSFRHPVPVDFLKKLSLVKNVELQYLEKISIVEIAHRHVYINENFKKYFDIPLFEQIKNHRFLATLYEEELNLKPFERSLLLSRNTMRKEKDYHLSLIPKDKEEMSKNFDNRMSYIAQSKALQNPWTKIVPKEVKEEVEQEIQKDKEEIENSLLLSKEELMLLSKEEREIYQTSVSESLPSETPPSLVDDAESHEKKYDWQNAVDKLEQALEKEENNPKILTKLSLDFAKLGDYENALEYAKRAISSYEAMNEPVKALYAGLNLANFYRESYSYNNALEYYEKIINTQFEIPPSLKGWAHLGIAEVNSDEMQFRFALDCALQSSDLSLIAEVYFQSALLFDDRSDYKKALKLYLKCIETSSDVQVNKNLSSAYFNVASIYFDEDDYESARKFLLNSLETDKQTQNYDGMFSAHLKLASLYAKISPKSVLEEINAAMECAQKLNDDFYYASALIELGDYYYYKRQDKQALEVYAKAKEILKSDAENLHRVNLRIEDIKARENL